jgi:hypothetical protein
MLDLEVTSKLWALCKDILLAIPFGLWMSLGYLSKHVKQELMLEKKLMISCLNI